MIIEYIFSNGESFKTTDKSTLAEFAKTCSALIEDGEIVDILFYEEKEECP